MKEIHFPLCNPHFNFHLFTIVGVRRRRDCHRIKYYTTLFPKRVWQAGTRNKTKAVKHIQVHGDESAVSVNLDRHLHLILGQQDGKCQVSAGHMGSLEHLFIFCVLMRNATQTFAEKTLVKQ